MSTMITKYTPEEQKALRETDAFDTRNIVDEFKGMQHEEICDIVYQRSTPLVIIAENLTKDFNVAQIVRAANAFGARKVYICGHRRWDKRGATGSYLYIDVETAPTTQEVIQQMRDEGYHIVCAELTDDAISLPEYQWDEKTAIIIGEEGKGITDEALSMCDDVVSIPMRGTVRSLNAAGAAQVMLYAYGISTNNI